MSINNNYIVVADLETGDKIPDTAPVIQIAAIVLHPRDLTVCENGTFETLILPDDLSGIKQEALNVNKKTIDQLKEKGLPEKVAWQKFHEFLKVFKTGKTEWDSPKMAGHNINNFDKPIIQRMFKTHGLSYPFHPLYTYDTMQMCELLFENRPDIAKYNLDYLRDKFGISKIGGHDALKDVNDTILLLKKFMIFFRKIAANMKLVKIEEPQNDTERISEPVTTAGS